jgi:CheY-like chemotaxis protein
MDLSFGRRLSEDWSAMVLGMESTTEANSEQSSEKVILVVDDDPDILEALSDILVAEGFAVRRARNGQEALARFTPSPPDLILLDLMMPVMDGFEFSQQMRKRPDWAKVPIVVLSADRNVSSKAREVGAVSHLAKPFELKELLNLVRRSLSAGGESDIGKGSINA